MEAVAVAEADTEGSVVIPRARQDLPRLIKFLGHAVLTFFCFPQDTGTDRQTVQTVQTVRAKVAAGAINNSTFIRFCGAEQQQQSQQQQQHLSLIITNSTHSPMCVCSVCV